MLYPNGSTTRPPVSSPFGPRTGGAFSFHYGADLVGFTTIRAVAAGKVTFAGWMNSNAGNTIVIDHGNGVTSVYMHNDTHSVTRGERVSEGQAIAVMGDTGNASGECNHLEIRVHGVAVEPLSYLADRLTRSGETAAPTTSTQKDEGMDFFNLQGKSGSHSAGTFAAYRGNKDGKLYIRRLTKDTFSQGVPTIPNDALPALQATAILIGL